MELRIGLTVVMVLLAAAGWQVLRRRGTRSATLPLLTATPFTLIALQSYGGEIFMRGYLFALPFASIPGAVAVDAVFSGPQRSLLRRAMRLAAAFALLAGLGVATVTARGGNDGYSSVSRADVAAMNYVYRHVRPGQKVAALLSDVPIGYADVGAVSQRFFDGCPDMADMTPCVLAARPDYLVVTPSQDNHGRIYYGLRPGWTGHLVRELLASGWYRQVFDDEGSRVLARNPQ